MDSKNEMITLKKNGTTYTFKYDEASKSYDVTSSSTDPFGMQSYTKMNEARAERYMETLKSREYVRENAPQEKEEVKPVKRPVKKPEKKGPKL